MSRKDMRSALKGSLEQEEQAIEDRFARAEATLEKPAKKRTPVPKPLRTEKVIRDSFTIPATDYKLIGTLKRRSTKRGAELTKSEVIRAGLIALNDMPDGKFLETIERVEKLKTGRPKQTA